MSNEPTPSATEAPAETPLHEQEAARLANLDAVRALGVNPYGTRTPGLVSLADARDTYDKAADEQHQATAKSDAPVDNRPRVTVSGRVMLKRDTGKLVWLNLRDQSGDLQIAVSKRDCAEPGFDVAKWTDLGDILVASGPLMCTRTGEVTVWASSVAAAAKSLTPPPTKHAGLQDVELRYRQRYVDLWSNPETMRVFALRSRILSHMRSIMDGRGYMEVETPMLQALAGGAAAKPFQTRLNALSMDVYMRIAPELYLKRLLVGGMPRVYEINRNFRNEGVDKQHNPEFTMLEAYEAFGDVTTMMDLTEHLCRESARLVVADSRGVEPSAVADVDLKLPFGEITIDYGAPFLRVPYGELFQNATGFAMTDLDKVWARAEEIGVLRKYAAKMAEEGKPLDTSALRGKVADAIIVNEVFEEAAEPTLDAGRPTFITDYPSAISPLTRPKPDAPELADRADLFIGGMELAPHYTELNDPAVQAEKFRAQLAGLDDEESTFRNFDEDFIRALKVGMPPAGGMGLGIDRLVMLLTDQRSIRDVLLFPFMRPE
ncbi:MAG: lysine--tRNA ligase [Planctomycetota bacterium]|nr:MAG: lysine--tRNA ligase [Planctomycetota bacterium]